jgi:hypothetical protein
MNDYIFNGKKVSVSYRDQFNILEYKGNNKNMLELREQIKVSWVNHLYQKTKEQ